MKLRKASVYILAVSAALYLYRGNVRAEKMMTLEDCLKSVMENNKQLRIAREKLLAARYKKNEAFGGYLPTLAVSGAYTYNHEINTVSFLGREIELGARKSYQGRLSLSQPLYMGGKIFEQNRLADVARQIAELDYEKQKEELLLQVKQDFYGLLLARQILRINQEAYDVTAAHLRVSEGLYKEGKLSSYDVSRVKVQLANQKTNLLRANNTVQIGYDGLLSTLGLEPTAEVVFAGQLGFVDKTVKGYEDGLRQALARRIEIRQIDLQEKASGSMLALARSDFYPNFLLNSTFSRQNSSGFSADLAWTNVWTTTLSLYIPLFEGWRTKARVKQAVAQRDQVKLSRQQLVESITIGVKQCYFIYEQTKENLLGQGENVDIAKDNLKIAQQRYKLGLMSDIEVRDAELALTQAETNFYQAIYEYLMAQANLEKNIGETLE